MKNPFSAKYSEERNQELVRQSQQGNRRAMDQLIHLHQNFIYNVAWKMVHDPQDAMDLTQETLLKVITKLSQFNFNSSFRTWLYRIVVNEFLQSKRRKGEERFSSFADYGEALDAIPNPDLTQQEQMEYAEQSRETQIRCMSGMLMCLTREQRLIYIVGDTFGIDHNLGAEIFETTKQNFRVKLHRARKDLYHFMNNQCGLVNQANPCRCPKKTKALREAGAIDETQQFNISYRHQIADYVTATYEAAADQVEAKYTQLYRNHPTKEDFNKETVIDQVLNDDELMKYFGS
jgi:RNA polymerase sigma factor (sigma-70 family)